MIRITTLLLATAVCIAGCSSTKTEQPTEEMPRVLGPNEKADDFRSESAQEYWVRGTATIEIEDTLTDATEDERIARVRELIPYKQVAIGYFLNAYLIDKSSHDDNQDYGGFKALTKNGSYEDLGIEPVDGLTYSFNFVQEIGGQLDLLEELGRGGEATPNEDGSWSLELTVGKLTNEEMMRLDHEDEWYRKAPWSGFNPTSLDASKLEQQKIEILAQPRSPDAWLDYRRLYEDGSVEIEVFFGWDYHSEYHRKHSESTYDWLIARGFQTSSDSYQAYAENRVPLKKTVLVDGRPVEFIVTLWWGEPGTITDPDTDAGGIVLENAMRQSLSRNEVTMFSGHSGPWYGFALANWRQTSEGDLDDSEVSSLDMPADKYQIVLAEGCDTYALGEAFWANPTKSDRKNLDIVTTTSFSNASTSSAVTDFLAAVTSSSDSDEVTPQRYGELLRNLDSNSRWFKTMYGVHGIDDNPHGHPFGNQDALCSACSASSECGPAGNRCVAIGASPVCSYECTADDGCPAGYACQSTETGGYLSKSYCVPATQDCGDLVAPSLPNVFFAETLPSPAFDLAGDTNLDGVRDALEDEYVEVRNTSAEVVDVSGWTIADSVTIRFTLPRAELAPGASLIVLGGGDPAALADKLAGTLVFAADGLYLNNAGDTLTLADADGTLIDRLQYGRVSAGGRLTRTAPSR